MFSEVVSPDISLLVGAAGVVSLRTSNIIKPKHTPSVIIRMKRIAKNNPVPVLRIVMGARWSIF